MTRPPDRPVADPPERWGTLGDDLRSAISSSAPLLISGDPDAGRLIARAVHEECARRRPAQFIEVTHPELPERLAALSARVVRASVADDADPVFTVFIDEVDRLAPAAQEMLLYFLDVVSGGEADERRVRVITAASWSLRARLEAGLLRADLFYRLNVIHLALSAEWSADEDHLLRSILAGLQI